MPHFLHSIQTRYHLEREITELYISVALRSFAAGMIIIFEPIYLFTYFGESLPKTLIYFGFISMLFGVFAPLGGKILARIGVKHAMLASMPFLFLYYLLLSLLDSHTSFMLVVLAIAVRVMHNFLYWPAFHTDFSRVSIKEKRGEQVGLRSIAVSLGAVSGPIIGGLIITQLGWSFLFGLVLLILIASVVPLFFSPEIHESYSDSFEKAFLDIFSKKFWKSSIAMGAAGIEFMINLILWPIFLFTLSITFFTLGIITSASLVLGVLFTLYIGRLSDRIPSKHRLLFIGSIFVSAAWIFKMFVTTPFNAFLAYTFYRISIISAAIPFQSIFYDKSAESDISRERVIIWREVSLNLARGFGLFAFAGVFFFTDKIVFAFPAAAFFALLINLI